MKSIWSQQTEIPKTETLRGNIRVHTAVIGAGMVGILTTYFLQKEGMDVVLVEAKRIADGQTKNTTAKITSQHGMIYERMLRKIGREKAEGYAKANEDAIKLYERIVKEEKIACHFEKLPAYLYSTDETRTEELKKEAETARKLGINAFFVKKEELKELPFETIGAVCFEQQAQFHPMEFIKCLTKKMSIYENTKVLSVKRHLIMTDRGNITAENIVFATHYPFINIPGFYFLRQHQERSYVIALENKKELTGMYYSIDKGGISLRGTDEVLLFGGGAHRTGKKTREEVCCQEKGAKEGFSYIRKMAKEYYSDSEEIAHWAAQDCMTHDDIPLIGRYSVFRKYWYVATGFNKWGMTSSMIAANIISNQICGNKNPYEKVFRPQRFYFRASIKKLLIDMVQSILGLTKGLFSKKERRCPHLGCKLEWNQQEQSWDCPCHGSRFDKDGELIDNPAQTSK